MYEQRTNTTLPTEQRYLFENNIVGARCTLKTTVCTVTATSIAGRATWRQRRDSEPLRPKNWWGEDLTGQRERQRSPDSWARDVILFDDRRQRHELNDGGRSDRGDESTGRRTDRQRWIIDHGTSTGSRHREAEVDRLRSSDKIRRQVTAVIVCYCEA